MKDAKKTKKLKQLIRSPNLKLICEAHNGISAKIVEETGFKGIWASSLTMSASAGVRDNNELSLTQILEILEYMSDVTTVPILVDGDTGYGNFNNMCRLVKKLEIRQIAGVCIEDKLFPKTNSFINSSTQVLADTEEFCGKIKAGKDTQQDDDFSIVARTEAFIAGLGLNEALRRAEAYRQAGADAILVHSKRQEPSEVEAFMREWGNRHPIVIVPTKYYSTPITRFRELNISIVIFANQLLRAAVATMKKIAQTMFETESLMEVEDLIVPVAEIFRLQGVKELQLTEAKYLPTQGRKISAIILAAARGIELNELTIDKPKTMVEIRGEPIITTITLKLRKLFINNINIVRGYKKETIFCDPDIIYFDNNEYDETGELYSLYLAQEALTGDTLIIYGDILFRNHLIEDLLNHTGDITLVVDAEVRANRKDKDIVRCSRPYTNDFFNHDIVLKDITITRERGNADGEWTGLMHVSEVGAKIIRKTMKNMASNWEKFRKLELTDLISELITNQITISVVYIKGGWLDVDDFKDLNEAGGFK